MLILYHSRYKREGTETFCLCILSNSLPLILSLTLCSALLWGAKAPVVANIAYYAMSLLSKRESCFFLSFNWLHKLLLLDKRRWIQLAEDGGV